MKYLDLRDMDAHLITIIFCFRMFKRRVSEFDLTDAWGETMEMATFMKNRYDDATKTKSK